MSDRDYLRGRRVTLERVLDLIRPELPAARDAWPAERADALSALEDLAKGLGVAVDWTDDAHLGDVVRTIAVRAPRGTRKRK